MTTLRNLNEGDKLRLLNDPDSRVRRILQKGKIEGYCPYDGQNTMGHSKSSGDEVYQLSTPCISLMPNGIVSFKNNALGKVFLFVEITQDALEYSVVENKIEVLRNYGGFDPTLNEEVGDDIYSLPLPPGDYQIILDSQKLSEEKANQIVERHSSDSSKWLDYLDYKNQNTNAIASLCSLLVCKGFSGRVLILSEK